MKNKTHQVEMLHVAGVPQKGDIMFYEGGENPMYIGINNDHSGYDKQIFLKRQYIIVLSDEPIKEGDYGLVNGTTVTVCPHENTAMYWNNMGVQKVVASNNKTLTPKSWIREGFTNNYVESWRENNPITEIDLEMTSCELEHETRWDIAVRKDFSVIIHESRKFSKKEMKKICHRYHDIRVMQSFRDAEQYFEEQTT